MNMKSGQMSKAVNTVFVSSLMAANAVRGPIIANVNPMHAFQAILPAIGLANRCAAKRREKPYLFLNAAKD